MESSTEKSEDKQLQKSDSASLQEKLQQLDWAQVEDSDDQNSEEEEDEGDEDSENDHTFKETDYYFNSLISKSNRQSSEENDKKNNSHDYGVQQQVKGNMIGEEKKRKFSNSSQISTEKTTQNRKNKNMKPPKPLGVQPNPQAQIQQRKDFGKAQKKKLNFRRKKSPTSQASDESSMTNPNSIYRKYYNQSKQFFLWVIQKEEPPFIFKVHIQAKSNTEINNMMIFESLKRQFSNISEEQLDIRFFAQKSQYKIFVELQNKQDAIKFFDKFYQMPSLSFVDDKTRKTFSRKMRAYLIQDEGTFEKLAIEKYQAEGAPHADKKSSESRGGHDTPGSTGSFAKTGKGMLQSLNNSSDDSVRGGSSNSFYGRGQEVNSARQLNTHNSSENILQNMKQRCLTNESFEEEIKHERVITITSAQKDIPKPPKKQNPRFQKKQQAQPSEQLKYRPKQKSQDYTEDKLQQSNREFEEVRYHQYPEEVKIENQPEKIIEKERIYVSRQLDESLSTAQNIESIQEALNQQQALPDNKEQAQQQYFTYESLISLAEKQIQEIEEQQQMPCRSPNIKSHKAKNHDHSYVSPDQPEEHMPYEVQDMLQDQWELYKSKSFVQQQQQHQKEELKEEIKQEVIIQSSPIIQKSQTQKEEVKPLNEYEQIIRTVQIQQQPNNDVDEDNQAPSRTIHNKASKRGSNKGGNLKTPRGPTTQSNNRFVYFSK